MFPLDISLQPKGGKIQNYITLYKVRQRINQAEFMLDAYLKCMKIIELLSQHNHYGIESDQTIWFNPDCYLNLFVGNVQVLFEDNLGVVDFFPSSKIGVIFIREPELVSFSGQKKKLAKLRKVIRYRNVFSAFIFLYVDGEGKERLFRIS